MHYVLKTGNWFLLMKDEVIDVLHICSAIWPFLLDSKKECYSELKLRKVFTILLPYIGDYFNSSGLGGLGN